MMKHTRRKLIKEEPKISMLENEDEMFKKGKEFIGERKRRNLIFQAAMIKIWNEQLSLSKSYKTLFGMHRTLFLGGAMEGDKGWGDIF